MADTRNSDYFSKLIQGFLSLGIVDRERQLEVVNHALNLEGKSQIERMSSMSSLQFQRVLRYINVNTDEGQATPAC